MALTRLQADGISNNAVGVNNIANNSVTVGKVANSAVTVDKLADLSVTTDKIAADAVTTTKIANTSVTAAKLASGAARTNFGTGAVLQVVQKVFSDVTVITTANAFQDVANGSLVITSTSANSKFLVTMIAQGYQSAGSGMNIGMSRVISSTTTRLLGTDGTSGNAWMGAGNGPSNTSYTIQREFLDAPNAAANTAITYKMLVALWSSATGVYVNYSGYAGESIITIQEIAG